MVRGAFSPSERSACLLRPEAAYRDSSHCEFISSSPRGWKGRRIELGEHALRFVQVPHKEEVIDTGDLTRAAWLITKEASSSSC